MSSRRIPPRKRPLRPATAAGVAAVVTEASPATDAGDQAQKGDGRMQEAIAGFVAEFEELLSNDPSMDAQMREFFGSELRQAFETAASSADVMAAMPDRAAWDDALAAMQGSGAISESEAEEVRRQLSRALQPLERRESKLAIEFSRRMAKDGEEKAIAWLQAEYARNPELAESASSVGLEQALPQALRTDVVKSRSRRLRGPPR